jgi:D-sedoheptulose 7-phosphate isomerase
MESLAKELTSLRDRKGRLFVLGVGGSAGNASHAVNDFRKLCGIEAYAPTDNVSELTARTNDEGWDTIFSEWLKVSNLNENDALLVFSVGGGNLEKNVSPGIVTALKYAKNVKSKIFGIVGRDGGFTNEVGDCVIVIPTVNKVHITPHTEAFHGIVWHSLVSNPILQIKSTKW